jgi:hypothetical protein
MRARRAPAGSRPRTRARRCRGGGGGAAPRARSADWKGARPRPWRPPRPRGALARRRGASRALPDLGPAPCAPSPGCRDPDTSPERPGVTWRVWLAGDRRGPRAGVGSEGFGGWVGGCAAGTPLSWKVPGTGGRGGPEGCARAAAPSGRALRGACRASLPRAAAAGRRAPGAGTAPPPHAMEVRLPPCARRLGGGGAARGPLGLNAGAPFAVRQSSARDGRKGSWPGAPRLGLERPSPRPAPPPSLPACRRSARLRGIRPVRLRPGCGSTAPP